MLNGESFDEDRSDISESSFDNQENSSDEVHKNGSSDNVTDQDLNEDIFEDKEFREDKIESLESTKHGKNKSSKRTKAVREIFKLYQRELDKRSQKSLSYEKEIGSKNNQIVELKAKIITLETKIRTESTLNQKAAKKCTENDLISAREEVIQTLSEKYGRACADLENVMADYKALQMAIISTGQEQAENIKTAQDAITSAVAAKVRCAELEEENTELIGQLIDLKTKYAIEMESEAAKNNALLTQLDVAADRLAAMEKKYMQALTLALPPGSKFSSEEHNSVDLSTQSSNRRNSYSNEGDCINVDDIYECRSIDENAKEVSPIFSRNSSRLASGSSDHSNPLSAGSHGHSAMASPLVSNSSSSIKSPFSAHLAETSGPQVNPLSSKNWLWK